MLTANAFGMPGSGWLSSRSEQGGGPVCAVKLIDRRTGLAHRVNGRPLMVFTRDPKFAAAELLEGRDVRLWQVRVEPLDPSEGGR